MSSVSSSKRLAINIAEYPYRVPISKFFGFVFLDNICNDLYLDRTYGRYEFFLAHFEGFEESPCSGFSRMYGVPFEQYQPSTQKPALIAEISR
jgi:hypothetical protein